MSSAASSNSEAVAATVAPVTALPTPVSFQGLPVAQLSFALRAEEPVALPNFLGSTLRGAFGHALKRAACLAPGQTCETCPLPHDCWYAWLFETQIPPFAQALTQQRDAPRPFILTPPYGDEAHMGRLLPRGKTLHFSLTLLGAATRGALYAAHAIADMAQRGLGAERGRFRLQAIQAHAVTGEAHSLDYDEQTGQFDLLGIPEYTLAEWITARLNRFTGKPRLKLRFVTRARLRVQDQLQEELSFATLLRFLLRRLELMLAIHGDGLPAWPKEAWLQQADKVETLAAALIRHDVQRRSSRQNRKLPHDGFLGELVYEGAALPQFLPLLVAGELLHVGSGATFGLGKYEMVDG